MDWKDFGNWILLAVTALAVGFALLYSFAAPWYRSALGRAMFGVLVSLAAGIGYFAWAVHHAPLPLAFYPIRALIFLAIAVSIGSSVILLAKAQLSGHPRTGRSQPDELANTRQDPSDGRGHRSDGGSDCVPRRQR